MLYKTFQADAYQVFYSSKPHLNLRKVDVQIFVLPRGFDSYAEMEEKGTVTPNDNKHYYQIIVGGTMDSAMFIRTLYHFEDVNDFVSSFPSRLSVHWLLEHKFEPKNERANELVKESQNSRVIYG